MDELARNGGHGEFLSRFIGESQVGFLGIMEGDFLLKRLLPSKPQRRVIPPTRMFGAG